MLWTRTVFLFLATACANTIAAKRPLDVETIAEVNGVLGSNPATVVFASSERREPVLVTVGAERTILESNDRTEVPTAAIRTIRVTRPGRGALDGLGLGFLGGTLVGAVAGALAGASQSGGLTCHDSPACLFPAIGAGVGAFAGAFIGMIAGAIKGHAPPVEFDPPPLP